MPIPEQLPDSWKNQIGSEFEKDYMKKLSLFLKTELSKKKQIYPKPSDIFNAFILTPFEELKVVILGQDPYHGKNQAHGLCFSVPQGIPPPPSLKNIYKEIINEFGNISFSHGDLSSWAKQGVLLLNNVLTVEANKAFSHQGKGWENFTDTVIKTISQNKKHCIFVLWGSAAQKKEELIDSKKHFILKSAHPSPLSAYRGFLGNNHFKKINEILDSLKEKPITWTH